MKKIVRNILIAVFILASVAYAVYYYSRPIGVEVIALQKQDVYDYIEATGTISSQNEVDVSSKNFGQVTAKYFNENDTVKKGDLLLKLDSTDINYQISILKSQIDASQEQRRASLNELNGSIVVQDTAIKQLQQNIDYKLKDLEQYKLLYSEGEISQIELDAAQQAYNALLNQKKQAEQTLKTYQVSYQYAANANGSQSALKYQLKMLENQLKDMKIYAPADGILVGYNIKKGGIVTSQLPIAEIVNPSATAVVAYVLVDDTYNLKVGDSLKLLVKINGKEIESTGTIKEIAQIAQERVSPLGLIEKSIKVTINQGQMQENLRIGSEVKVKFVRNFKLNAIAIPKTSIFYKEDKKIVFADNNGRAQEVIITTSMETDTDIVVESGLNAGDQLIKNYKVDGLADGKRVNKR